MIARHQKERLEIAFDIEINATPEQVWALLASREGMHQWFSTNLVFEMEIGGQFRMQVNEGEKQWLFFGEVQMIDPNHELAFTWIQQEVGQKAWPVDTLVTFKLEEIESGTKVSLIHSGFEALDEAIASEEYEDHIQGWQRSNTLSDLKSIVEATIA